VHHSASTCWVHTTTHEQPTTQQCILQLRAQRKRTCCAAACDDDTSGGSLQLTSHKRAAAGDATKWWLAVLACRNVMEFPIPAVVALAEKLKGDAIAELQELVAICRGKKKNEVIGCEVCTVDVLCRFLHPRCVFLSQHSCNCICGACTAVSCVLFVDCKWSAGRSNTARVAAHRGPLHFQLCGTALQLMPCCSGASKRAPLNLAPKVPNNHQILCLFTMTRPMRCSSTAI
jgi:hypothetical protein